MLAQEGRSLYLSQDDGGLGGWSLVCCTWAWTLATLLAVCTLRPVLAASASGPHVFYVLHHPICAPCATPYWSCLLLCPCPGRAWGPLCHSSLGHTPCLALGGLPPLGLAAEFQMGESGGPLVWVGQGVLCAAGLA